MKRLWAVLLALALVLCARAAAAEAAAADSTLYPACGGEIYSGSAIAKHDVVVHTFPGALRSVSLTCLAFDVTSVTGGQQGGEAADHCAIKHQTTYAYRLFLRATGASTPAVVHEFDLRDVAGGSIASVVARAPNASTFALVMRNEGADSRCTLKVRAIFNAETSDTATSDEAGLPSLVAAAPPMIYPAAGAPAYVVLRHHSDAAAAQSWADHVTLVPLDAECGARTAQHMNRAEALPEGAQQLPEHQRLAAYSFTFYHAGTYRVCYKAQDMAAPVEVAALNVFAGNPSSFEILGLEESGQVLINKAVTVKFNGYDLDTRPDGDRAKLVLEADSCDTGVPAGGVPLGTDLGPADDYGPNTTYTLWPITITQGGAYKVCYQRRASGAWTEVPSVADVGPATTPAPTAAPLPVPTDPVTRADCPMAPASTARDPWLNYRSVRLVLAGEKVPADFVKTLTQIFCLPAGAITPLFLAFTEEKKQVVYFSVICGKDDRCSSLERFNYIAHLGRTDSATLRHAGIQTAECSTSMFAYDETGRVVVYEDGSALRTFMICLTVLAALALVAYAVVKYREKREYFVQFGMDDGDIDDLYDHGVVPGPLNTHFDDEEEVVPLRAGRVGGAVIEIEDY